MKLGSNDISAVKIGSTDVNKIYIGSTEVWTSFTGLLDTYSGASAAYSLRRLSSTYTGSAIEVRRDSDNATQDIGFVNNELDVTTLESFCSGTDGFVTTWYDQSGNGNDATQTTASSQPKIYDSVSGVINVNSKPSIDIVSGGVRLDLPNSTYLYNKSQFFGISVSLADGVGGSVSTIYTAYTSTGYKAALLYGFTTNQRYEVGGRRNKTDAFTNVVDSTNFINQQVLQIGHLNYTDGIASIYTNNNSVVTNNSFLIGNMDNTSNTTVSDNIGGYEAFQFFDGKIQEVIIYASNQLSNVSGMKSNINDFYNIY